MVTILMLLLLVIFVKYFFILFSPLVYFWNQRTKKMSFTVNKYLNEYEVPSNITYKIKLKSRIGYLLTGIVRYYIIKIGYIPSHFIRNILYKKVLQVTMKRNSIIYYGAEIRAPYNLELGFGTIIGDKVTLDARNKIIIGDNVNFSSNVTIWTEQHDHRDEFFRCNSDSSFNVVIGNRVWIGPNVIILPGVEIGEGAVIGAGSVVTKDIIAYSVCAGVPAKKIGIRNKQLSYEFKEPPLPFY